VSRASPRSAKSTATRSTSERRAVLSKPAPDPDALVARALDGDRAAIAKLISLVETGGDAARRAVTLLHPHTGHAWSIGMTGAPGAGKSTLTDRLVARLRADDLEVGVLAIDPTSPFSGGAILGDRVRMQEHATDGGVFIRSMATRGHLGGLAVATPQAVRVLDAAGKPWIIVETVGVGQVEVEIAGQADTTIVVVNPGWGDAVQAAKAGLLEIADVFVVNKADRPGVDDTVRDLEGMLEMAGERSWKVPIVRTVATTGDGIDAVWDAVREHRAFLEETGEVAARRAARVRDELRSIVAEQLLVRATDVCRGDAFDALVDAVAAHRRDPYSAADEVLAEL
jgi:GTPase